jgi:beta-lactamase regulating signal transducer with metallopeptidase domain
MPAANALSSVQRSIAPNGATALPVVHRAPLPWTFWIALVWFVGGAMVLGHLLLGYLSLWLLQRRCARISDGECHEQLNRLREILNVRRNVKLLSTPGRAMPMTWGLWRATLLLPRDAANWTSEQRKDVLLHELAHVRRFDCATQLLVQITCALYWFNPLVWIARNRVQVERERACDDIVLNTGAMAPNYARHLLQSATAMPALRFVTAALAMARPSTLEARLSTILDASRNRRSLSGSATWITLALLMIVIVPVAALNAQENPVAPANTGSASGTASSAGSGEAARSNAPATRPAPSGDSNGRPAARSMFGGGGIPTQDLPKLGEGPTCAFDATIYDIRLPADKISQLDLDALTKAAATTTEFEKALADLGTSRPLYHTDQTVRLAADSITIGTETPFVTNSRTDANGHVINSVQYQSLGTIFEMAGKSIDAGKIDFDLKIRMSGVSDSSAAISRNIKSPLFRNSIMSHKGVVEPKTPFLVLSADAATADENGNAVAYIARITLGAPQ